MGIRFYCPACDKKINVKEHQAGLRGICPKCGAGVNIPRQSEPKRKGPSHEARQKALIPGIAPGAAGEQTLAVVLPKLGRLLAVTATPPPDPLAEFPHYQWYVVPQGSTEPFGPADATLLQQWMHEGRIGARSLVWRQDWPEWRKAGGVWSQLLLVEADPATTHVERRATAAAPRFPTLSVPTMPSAPAGSQIPARRAWSSPPPAAAVPASQAAGFGEPHGELYYPRRSNGMYLTAVVLLTLAVVVLSYVTWIVIDKVRNRTPTTPDAGEASERTTYRSPEFFHS
jgi:hypothetical protein